LRAWLLKHFAIYTEPYGVKDMDAKIGKFFIFVAPYLAGAGNVLVNLDPDEQGTDDFVGNLLLYGSDVISAVMNGEDLPPLPSFANQVISGRISGPALITLQVVSAALAIAQFQVAMVNPKAGIVFRYINQVVRALVAGQTPPAIPPALQ
jgi:hypothetical protein